MEIMYTKAKKLSICLYFDLLLRKKARLFKIKTNKTLEVCKLNNKIEIIMHTLQATDKHKIYKHKNQQKNRCLVKNKTVTLHQFSLVY